MVYKLFSTFWKCQNTQALFILEVILYVRYIEIFFQQFALFLAILFASKLFELSQ